MHTSWLRSEGWALWLGASLACTAQTTRLTLPSLGEVADPRARVVIVHDSAATVLYQPVFHMVESMVNRGLANLTSKSNVAAAWQSLVSTQETVGFKVFTGPGSTMGSRLAVVESLLKGLLDSGHPPGKILIWDKHRSDLVASGYSALADRYHVRIAGAASADFDENVYYENPLLGNLVFGDHEFGRDGEGVGRKSYVSRLVTKEMDKIILVSPLLNHNRAGVCGNLFSLASGSVDNFIRFEADGGRLAAAVPEIVALPELGDRVILNVVDALICQYQGQERELLHYATVLNEVRLSRDPVALDVLSLQELKRQREAAQIQAGFLNMELYHNASLLEIGISHPERIYLERLSDLDSPSAQAAEPQTQPGSAIP